MKTFKNLAPFALPILIRESDESLHLEQSFFMENQIEIWKPVVGWEDMYLVSNFGKIRSLDRRVGGPTVYGRVIKGKLRKPLNVKGYLSINLIDKKSGKSTRNGVHVFVAHAFIPNPQNKKCVNHIDGNKQNNNVKNLEWCTHQENNIHAFRTGLNKPRKFTEAQKAILRECAKKNQTLVKWQKENKSKMVELALRASLLQAKKVNQLDNQGNFIKQWCGVAAAMRATNLTRRNILNCITGKLKTAGGFRWEYAQTNMACY
jgi:hypothetical protein